jgi:ketosteroid isomerase-like protein
VVVLAAGMVAGCVAQRLPESPAAEDRGDAGLNARTAAFSRAIIDASASGWSSEAVARVADFYTDDTVVFPPRADPVRGKQAITDYWRRTPDRRILAHRVVAERIDVSGDLGTEYGRLIITAQRGDDEPVEATATYISIWKRDSGIWRKQMDTWW